MIERMTMPQYENFFRIFIAKPLKRNRATRPVRIIAGLQQLNLFCVRQIFIFLKTNNILALNKCSPVIPGHLSKKHL